MTYKEGTPMKYIKWLAAFSVTLALLQLPLAGALASQNGSDNQTAQSTSALERGYRTGYTDGYQGGVRDAADRSARDFRSKRDYQRGDRAYSSTYGSLEDYRDGYQQGFEVGYGAGFEGRGFDSTIPTKMSRRSTDKSAPDSTIDDSSPASSSGSSSSGRTNSSGGSTNGSSGSSSRSGGSSSTNSSGTYTGPADTRNVVTIPGNTVLTVELLQGVSTQVSQKGDPFQARIVEPQDYAGSIIDGKVTRVKKAGRGHGSSELQLSFDTIRLPDGRTAAFSAQVIEVVQRGGTGVGDVDEEGGVKSKSNTKDDVAKIGGGAGLGAIIGAIAGGGGGALIGAAIGAGVGTGGVLASHGENIRLNQGQQLRIRTATTARFGQGNVGNTEPQ
jgi:hypothetical protein